MGLEGSALHKLKVEHPDIQQPLGADLWVQLAQGAGGSVSGVGKGRLVLLLPLAVELVEHILGHEHLTPHDQPGQFLWQDHRDGLDRAEVFCHILPHPAITPGRTPDELAIPVLQGHA